MKQSLGAKTLLFPTPVLMVGTYDKAGKPNLMNAAWGGICCSDPPCVTVSLRKARHSYNSIIERKAFTVGIANEANMTEADYVGIATGRNADKFAVAGLTPVRSELVDAPYAEEFPVVLECRLLHTLEIGIHTQFIGEIIDVKVDKSTLSEDGMPDILKIQPLVYDTAHKGYHAVGALLGKAFSVGKKIVMSTDPSSLDRTLAKICELCPVCLHARYHQKGMVFDFVKNIEQEICPFCKAYERVHGKKAHEKRG